VELDDRNGVIAPLTLHRISDGQKNRPLGSFELQNRREMMKNIITGALIITALLATTPVFAQSDTGAKAGATTGAVTGAVGGALVGGPIGAVIGGVVGATAGATVGSLSADDKTYIQTYVYKSDVPSVNVEEPIVVGRPLPSSVKVYAFDRPNLNSYHYARVNNQYLLIDARGNVVGSIVL
jgi:hypothetical protein